VAHRVIFMDEGRIVEEAPSASFFSDPQQARTREFLAHML
jgi:polar amino acid transport system ATP-binding protein